MAEGKFRKWADWVKKHRYLAALIAVVGVVAAAVLIGLVVTTVIHGFLPLVGLVVLIPTVFVIGAAIYNRFIRKPSSHNDEPVLIEIEEDDSNREPEPEKHPVKEKILALYNMLSTSLFPGTSLKVEKVGLVLKV